MKIASWNINGIRACLKKGLLEWIESEKPDVICFQETKACEHLIPDEIVNHPLYNCYFHSAERKGYSVVGVMIKKKLKPISITKGINKKEFDSEGRTIIAEFKNFILFCCYFPNGGRDHERVPYKLKYSKAIHKYINTLSKPVVITGDFNTAHHEIDLKNPKTNQKTSGFLPIERKWMDEFLKEDFVDAFRYLHPDKKDEYTWWTYRGDCRARNIGWRIDYFCVSNQLLKKVKDCFHDRNVLGSDHCPLYLDIKV
ncbi:MAG: exodeoxyribonuclease III [Bacteriovoracaceae bacterium]